MIVLKINNKKENDEIQTLLFKKGYRWIFSGASIEYFDSYPIYLYLESSNISWSCRNRLKVPAISPRIFLQRFCRMKLKI